MLILKCSCFTTTNFVLVSECKCLCSTSIPSLGSRPRSQALVPGLGPRPRSRPSVPGLMRFPALVPGLRSRLRFQALVQSPQAKWGAGIFHHVQPLSLSASTFCMYIRIVLYTQRWKPFVTHMMVYFITCVSLDRYFCGPVCLNHENVNRVYHTLEI